MSNSRLVVVTGAASGIGLALAEAYASRGAELLMADLNADALTEALDKVTASGAVAHSHVVDLRDANSVAALRAHAESLGPIAATCLNAGVTSTGSTVWETPVQLFDSVIDVNLRGLLHCFREFIPLLIKQGEPADVLVTASMAGLVTSGWSGAYAASKAGAIALTKALHAELGGTAPQIRVALLNPGMVKTNLIRSSVATLPDRAGISDEMVDVTHDALNDLGVEPGEAAQWSIRALEERRFWVLPPEADMFSGLLDAELEELRTAIRG